MNLEHWHCMHGLGSALFYYRAYGDYVAGEVFKPCGFKLLQKLPQHSGEFSMFKLVQGGMK